jgi:hypothetical protein
MLNWSRNPIFSTHLPCIELCSVTELLIVVNSDWTASTRREKYLQEITRVRYVSVSYIEIPFSSPPLPPHAVAILHGRRGYDLPAIVQRREMCRVYIIPRRLFLAPCCVSNKLFLRTVINVACEKL